MLSAIGLPFALSTVAQPTNLPSLIQAAEQTSPLSPESIPAMGTFYSAQNPNTPPTPSDALGLPAWNLGNGLWLLNDFDVDYSSFTPFGNQIRQPTGRMNAMSALGAMSADFASADSLGSLFWTVNTNGLWLQITNVTTDTAYLVLNNATNQVYAIWSTTNFTNGSWQVETEIWPTNGVVMPFTIPTFGRSNLFMLAEDWTGVTENGNTTPDWWFFQYFGQSAFPNGHLALSDTTLDAQGVNTLLYDYQHNTDPNQIQFVIPADDLITNSSNVTVSVLVMSGVPSFYAVLVDSTNFSVDQAAATWIPYTPSSVAVNLGSVQGKHSVFIGLRGLPSNGAKAWEYIPITLDTTPPVIIVTQPASTTVSQPLLQLQGVINEQVSGLTFDVSNSVNIVTSQKGYTEESYYDPSANAFTTNSFQCYDIALAGGINTITIHATDLAGNTSSTNINVTLDLSSDTTPPALTILWPQNGTQISGSSVTLQAQVDNLTDRVIASANGNSVQGQVQRNGQVRGLTLPISAGTNAITVTATDAAGNLTTTNFSVLQSSLAFSITSFDALANQSSVTVNGTVGDPTEIVMINGVQATVNSDGSWTANNVPVNSSGMASISAQAYPNGSDPTTSPSDAEQQTGQTQPPLIACIAYQSSDLDYSNAVFNGSGPEINWTEGAGGWNNVYNAGGTFYVHDPLPSGNWESVNNEYYLTTPPWWIYQNFDFNNGIAFGVDGPYLYVDTRREDQQLVLENGGEGSPGTSQLYAIYVEMDDAFGDQLPATNIIVGGQTLAASGLQNDEDGNEWAVTVLNVPSGTRPDITPRTISTAGSIYPPPSWDWGTTGQRYTYMLQATQLTLQMAVDANRDGQITFDGADATTQSNPWRFWVNSAQESGDISSSANAVPGSSNPNSALSQINGRSDLINFFPVALSFSNTLQMFPTTDGWEYHLAQAGNALKFVYTSLSPGDAFDYLTNTASTGYGVNGDEDATNADTIPVLRSDSSGTKLDANWLAHAQANGGSGVILMEGALASTQPLMLELWRNGQKVGGVSLYMSISPVEQMYRWVNLRPVLGQAALRTTDTSQPPNYPDALSNGKDFIFVHGYNVDETSARGWSAVMFKRMYQSRSRAMFTAVTWHGEEGQWPVLGITPDYYANVVNAFDTAPYLADAVAVLPGQKYIAGHSLGNMVVSSAISDWRLNVNAYFMINAAVAMEAYEPSLEVNTNLVPMPYWPNYHTNLWASCWYSLFSGGDNRTNLTWRGRFGNIPNAYNYYSSTENVLADADGESHTVFASAYSWVNQEMYKGSWSSSVITGFEHSEAGWSFNIAYSTNSVNDANSIANSQLTTIHFSEASATARYTGTAAARKRRSSPCAKRFWPTVYRHYQIHWEAIR